MGTEDADEKNGKTGDDKSGKIGDDAGKTGDDAGKTGDDAGKTGDESGKTGGESGKIKLDIQEILDDYGLDSADDLKNFIANLNEMKGKIGDDDLDTLLDNSKTLKRYQASWAQQEEEKLKEQETPEDTIKRLEKEKRNLQSDKKADVNRQKAAKAAEQALGDFGEAVNSVIKSNKALPKEYRPFMAKFMGVDNDINEVDITDKAAVRRLTKAGMEEFAALQQRIIKDYLAGKTKIPKVTTTETTSDSSEAKGANPKNLKEAKRIMMESVGAFTKT